MRPITNSLDNISLCLLKGLITIDLIENEATIKNASNYQFLRQYFTFFIEKTHHYYFIEKEATVKNASNYQFLRQYFTFFIESTYNYWFLWKRGNCKEYFQLIIPESIFHFFYWKDLPLLIALEIV